MTANRILVLLAGYGLMGSAVAQPLPKPLDLDLPYAVTVNSMASHPGQASDSGAAASRRASAAGMHCHGFLVGGPKVHGEVGTGFVSRSHFGTGQYVEGIATASQALGHCGRPAAVMSVTIGGISGSGFGPFYDRP